MDGKFWYIIFDAIKEKKMKKKILISLGCFLGVILLVVGGTLIYLNKLKNPTDLFEPSRPAATDKAEATKKPNSPLASAVASGEAILTPEPTIDP